MPCILSLLGGVSIRVEREFISVHQCSFTVVFNTNKVTTRAILGRGTISSYLRERGLPYASSNFPASHFSSSSARFASYWASSIRFSAVTRPCCTSRSSTAVIEPRR